MISNYSIIAVRKRGPSWIFKWVESEGWICKQRKHTYRLFFESQEVKQVWVGMLISYPAPGCWITMERELGIIKLESKYITVVFKEDK